MAHCVNRSSQEFTALAEQSNINPIVLAAKVSLWQEVNGLDNFPTISDIKTEEILPQTASPQTIALIKDFTNPVRHIQSFFQQYNLLCQLKSANWASNKTIACSPSFVSHA